MSHTETDARRFVHLSEHHDRFVQHAGVLHFTVELLAFAATFADAAEQADALVAADHVVDHLGDQDGFSDARATEQAGLSAAFHRSQQVNRLNTADKNLGRHVALCQGHGMRMNRTTLHFRQRFTAVNRCTEHVEHTA